MTLDEIIRFFSGAADGQRMTDQPAIDPVSATTPIAQAMGAGGGRGVVNPALVNPDAPRPRMAPQAPPLPVTEIPNAPPIAAAMAPQPAAPEQPPAMALAMDPNATRMGPQQGAQPVPGLKGYEQGILSKMGFQDGNQAMMALGAALSAAGSPDPAKTALGFVQMRQEQDKARAERLKALQPKRDQIAGTPVAQIIDPVTGKLLGEEVSPVLAAFYKAQGDSKMAAAVEKAVLDDRLARGRDASKADIAASEGAKPVLNDIQSLKGRWEQAKEIVASQGTAAQVQGIPGIAGVAGFFGGDEVAKNKFLEGLTVDETLLNTARTKGAISNQEMMLFKSPIPSITDDREKVWKPWIEKRLEVLGKLEQFYAGEAGRSSGGAAAAASPPPSDQLKAAVAASGIAYEPEKYQYRLGPNGQVQRKAK